MLFTTSIKHEDEFSSSSGKTQLVYEIESINQSIRLILLSSRYELFGDPAYGSRLQEFIFDYEGDLLNGLIKEEIVRAISVHEPRVEVTDKDITIEDTYDRNLKINIKYKIKRVNAESNIDLVLSTEEGLYEQ